ncbi:MAG: M20 family metallo-hydrolase [Firmicutes bacterium]|nr:M20 family metallo-hydrolase [Bacillota bacterium]
MKINGERLLANLHQLREFTNTPGEGVTRFSYSPMDAKAREFIIKRAEAAGCSVAIDPLQNIRIGLKSNVPGRKTVFAGSHIDTVQNGGWLDGIYGVCGALEVLETLTENLPDAADAPVAGDGPSSCDNEDAVAGSEPSNMEAGSDRFLPSYNYEVIIFAEEEGSNFGSTMTGSKFLTGIYTEPDLDKLCDDRGRTLRDALASLNDIPDSPECRSPLYNREDTDVSGLVLNFDEIKTMLELHIEQGPVLDREHLQMGIVDSIFGMRVVEFTLTGVGNHAGATPMAERFDALCTAAEAIVEAEKIVRADEDKRTVVTFGKLDVLPNQSNVIPETVKFTMEVRDKDPEKIDAFTDACISVIEDVAKRRGVTCEKHEHSKSSPLHLSDRLIEGMVSRADASGISYKVMDSGAVHDACMLAGHVDTGMIFAPSIRGRSHVPEEDTKESDLVASAQFLMDTVLDELK